MTREEQAVIDAAKAYRANTTGMTGTTWADLNRALSALEDLENPQPVVFPDPPTDHIAWQGRTGDIWHPHGTDRNPNVWRELRVTYTPMGEPSPSERIAELMDSNLRMLNRIAELEWFIKHQNAAQNDQVARIIELEADRDEWKQTATERYFLSDPIHPDRFKTTGLGVKFVDMPQPDDDADLLWGVQWSDGEVHQCGMASAYATVNVSPNAKVVRLRVIELPEVTE